jgi:hypothetical protein
MSRRIPQRRITDNVRAIFHEACETRDMPAAEVLLNGLIKRVVRPRDLPSGVDRRKAEDLVGPCERLANMQLQQPHAEPPNEDQDERRGRPIN